MRLWAKLEDEVKRRQGERDEIADVNVVKQADSIEFEFEAG
jgi:hypothetical protein